MSTILLVEDDFNTGVGLAEILNEEGYNVIWVENAEQALQKINAQVDLLLTDLRLPDQSGLELSKQVKAIYPNILTIIMTAFTTPELKKQALDDGVFRWLMKPLNLDQLLTDIQEALKLNDKLKSTSPLHQETTI